MADPRNETNPGMRRANHSRLMEALKNKGSGTVVNFCPFGCEDHQLDENGWCAHLIGFYNGGNTYEPRIRRKSDKRIIVSGKARLPMEKGFVLVRITTTARVYSPKAAEHLAVKRDDADREYSEVMERERQLLEAAEKVRNPVLEGEWESAYERPAAPAAAAT